MNTNRSAGKFKLPSLVLRACFALCLAGLTASASEPKTLWQIGAADADNGEFALAPRDYNKFTDDGVFVVGESNAKKDWPYVHPGPSDGWAGGRSHTFTVIFGLVRSTQGTCRLVFDLLDAQQHSPPTLRVEINGRAFERKLAPGAGDASIHGDPKAGKRSQVAVEFPADALKPGNNKIDITTVSGSWFLYDRLALETPAELDNWPAADMTALYGVQTSPVLVPHDGRECQRLALSVLHVGKPAEIEVQLGAQKVQTVTLQSGRQQIEVFAPAESKTRKTNLTLAQRGKVLAYQPVTLVPGIREIVIVFKTHFDIGYTDMASNIVQRYRTSMIDQALDVVDQNRDLPPAQQFAWTLAGWPLHKILEEGSGQSTERKQRVEQALKQGRFVVHALPFTTHTELLEPEDLVRGLGYSSQLVRRLGLDMPRDGKMTDVPEHSWMMATLLKKAGVDFMMIGCNGASAALQVPWLYWWEGPDHSRVLTMYSPDYGTQLTPPNDWPYRTWLACLHTGDNHGPPRPDEVKKVLDQAARQFPGVKVKIGRLSDFGDAILAEKADLPVVRRDAPDTWIHGPMSDPPGARLARNTRPLIAATESINTQLPLWGVEVPPASATVAAAYEQSLLYGEHTWGGAFYWIHNKMSFGKEFEKERAAGRFQRLESSWDEHTAYIEKARQLILPELEKNLQALAANVSQKGTRIVIYNPLPWRRSGLVTVQTSDVEFEALRPSDGGQTAMVEKTAGEIRFYAENIPAMGYRTYVPAKPGNALLAQRRLLATNNVIESPFFKASFDPARGTVASLLDKRTGRELIDASANVGMGQYLYERFDNDQVMAWCKDYVRPGWLYPDFYKPGLPTADQNRYAASSPTNFQLRLAKSAFSVRAIMESQASAGLPGVTTELVLYHDQPWADLEITLQNKPMDPWPEAGWLCLPFNVTRPQFQLGRLGSIIDPTQDVLPGANRHLFGINTGVTVSDAQGRGVGFCPMDNPLVSLDSPGCWKYSLDFVPKKPVAYVNLFNNQWNTNFRLWNQGTWKARVRLWAMNNNDREKNLVTPALETRFPLQAVLAAGNGGKTATTQRGLELSRRGVLVTAFGANPDGAGTVLRLWEYAGEPDLCWVFLPQSMNVSSVQPIDLRGRPAGEPIPVINRGFKVKLGAFEPASFLIRSAQ